MNYHVLCTPYGVSLLTMYLGTEYLGTYVCTMTWLVDCRLLMVFLLCSGRLGLIDLYCTSIVRSGGLGLNCVPCPD